MKLTEVESNDVFVAKKDLDRLFSGPMYDLDDSVHNARKADALHGYRVLLDVIERLTSEPEPKPRSHVLNRPNDRPKRHPNRD